MSKPTVAIIGSGWGGFTLSQLLSLTKYNVTVISPLRTIQYTPLLASAATGLFNFRLAEEPIRRRHRSEDQGLTYLKATASSIDFASKLIHCKPAVSDLDHSATHAFTVPYDALVLAPGCAVQTFDTPGALAHALFLRTTSDARRIQARLLEMLDAASLPGLSDADQRALLCIRVVGGGAVGIEATAELYDAWHNDLRHVYPHLDGKVSLAIHDVAPAILSTFDAQLGAYARDSLRRKNVEICTGSHIERVERDAIFTAEQGRLPFGMLIWATGNKASPLVEALEGVKRPEKGLPRILVDGYLRVLRAEGGTVPEVYALGDAADIEGNSHPTLAEVALQQGEYLSAQLNKRRGVEGFDAPWRYRQKSLMAYLGRHDGVVGGKTNWTGQSAWLAWRSGSLAWTRSWRRRVMISISWLMNMIGGRDIARK